MVSCRNKPLTDFRSHLHFSNVRNFPHTAQKVLSKIQYGRSIYGVDASFAQKLLYPVNSLSSCIASGKESPLLCSGKSNKKCVQLLTLIRYKAPPSLIVRARKISGVEFKSLTFMNGHKSDLTNPFKFIQSLLPVAAMLRTFFQKCDKSRSDSLKVLFSLIRRKGLP